MGKGLTATTCVLREEVIGEEGLLLQYYLALPAGLLRLLRGAFLLMSFESGFAIGRHL